MFYRDPMDLYGDRHSQSLSMIRRAAEMALSERKHRGGRFPADALQKATADLHPSMSRDAMSRVVAERLERMERPPAPVGLATHLLPWFGEAY